MASATVTIRGMTAGGEIRPTSATQLGEILARANVDGTACCIAGGSTKKDWGNRPDRFDLLVSTTGLRGFSDVDADNLTLSVAAGTTVAEARAQAEAVDRILPLDPGNPGRATIGGVTATGDQGTRAVGYGGLRDVVLGVQVTLADGSAVKFGGRTMKNVTGYDMTKLFVGSFGALGVITEVTFRLLPRYDTQAVVVLPLPSLEQAKASAARILGSYLLPLALEVVSADILPSELAGSPVVTAAGAGGPVLLAGFAGHRAAVDRSIREVAEDHPGSASEVLRNTAAEALYHHLADAGAVDATAAIDANRGFRVAARASVPISRALDLVGTAERYAGEQGFSVAYRAGAARGRVDLVFDDRLGASTSEGREDRFAACVSQMRTEAVKLGGSLFVTRGSSVLPADFDAWGDVGPALALMRRLKERFDPNRVLNPGRFVGGI